VINGIEDSCDCLVLKMRDGRNQTLGARTRNEKPETRNEKREPYPPLCACFAGSPVETRSVFSGLDGI
jgi:hypothetical protein